MMFYPYMQVKGLSDKQIKVSGDCLNPFDAVSRIKSGDETVYGEIIDEYSRYLSTVINNVYSLNIQDTEDIIAETILTLWKNARKLKTDMSFKSYLSKIARNKTIDFVRKRRANFLELSEAFDNTVFSGSETGSGIETDFLQKELLGFINEKIGETKEPDRTILILKYIHGLKNKEIAERLDLNQNVVNIKLTRQRQKLRKLILGMEVQ